MPITDNDLALFRSRAKTELKSTGDIGRLAWDDVVVALCKEVARLRSASKKCGDMAKLREALEFCLDFIMRLDRAFNPYMQNLLEDAIAKAEAALSSPLRNCDVPLVVDGPADNNADKAWLVFKQHNPDVYFDVPGLLRCIDWLLAPVTEQEGGDDGNE